MVMALSACAVQSHNDAAAGILAPDSPHRIARTPSSTLENPQRGRSKQVFDSNFAFDIQPHSRLAVLEARIGVDGITTAPGRLHWDGAQDSALDAELQGDRLRRVLVTTPDEIHLIIDVDNTPAPQTARSVAPEPKVAADNSHAAVAAVMRWAAAWSARDINHYLAAYAPDFRGHGHSRTQWISERTHHLLAAGHIQVQVIDPQVELVSNDRARIHFEQRYRAFRHRDDTHKVLEMSRVNGSWLIVGENAS
jgi:hypothetical protein